MGGEGRDEMAEDGRSEMAEDGRSEMRDDGKGRRPENGFEEMLTELRDGYNPPPETPREEMWADIQARIGAGGSEAEEGDRHVISMRGRRSSTRERRSSIWTRAGKPVGWAAAAAVLVLGLGIGRMTAPSAGPVGPGSSVASEVPWEPGEGTDLLKVAAADHLSDTESLLTLVRADARSGRLDPAVGSWARGLLTQTRLLMDAQGTGDPAMQTLLKDLELVLVQIVGAANAPAEDTSRVQSELILALDGLEQNEVLTRIQAVVPAGPRFAGT